jgi:hypothetical protein
MDCLADSFVFYPREEDVNAPGGLPPFWRRGAEDTIHTNMFSEEGPVDRITLTLTTTSIDTVSIPGERGAEWIYTEDVDLRVWIGSNMYWATTPSGFTVALDLDDVGPQGETLYEIREWHDLDIWRGGAVPDEESSWGTVKALFR